MKLKAKERERERGTLLTLSSRLPGVGDSPEIAFSGADKATNVNHCTPVPSHCSHLTLDDMAVALSLPPACPPPATAAAFESAKPAATAQAVATLLPSHIPE